MTAAEFFAGIRHPPVGGAVQGFDRGWVVEGADEPRSHLSYIDFAGTSWSDDLEEIHEESSRDHFMDVLTRTSLLAPLEGAVPDDAVIADLGCSTGYLLEDLARTYPAAQLIGVDVIAAGLVKAHANVPTAALLLADVCDLPIESQTVDAAVSANMLEHVADDVAALAEIHRILRPGSVAAFVVPYGPHLFDYYDRFLGHERRYGRGELAARARRVGFEVVTVGHLGQLLYPPFVLVKKRNRYRRDRLQGAELRAQVEHDIAATTNSPVGALATRIEQGLTRRGLGLPFGIRELVVVRKAA